MKDFTIELSAEAKAKMESDPDLAEAMREVFAVIHQAHAAVAAGQYATWDDAMEAITGNRPEPVGFDEEDDDDD